MFGLVLRCGRSLGWMVSALLLGACSPAGFGPFTAFPSTSASDPNAQESAAVPPAAWSGKNQSLRIPGGQACLDWLPKRGIQYRPLPARVGVETPVEVLGPIAGVKYRSGDGGAVVADCRLVLALDWIGPYLREQGVSEVGHSGAYVYRTQKNGRPSRHALGLAIDLHRFRVGGASVDVETQFGRGLGEGCGEDAPALNRIVCQLRRLQLFEEVITPDHNADHHDHIHLAISPVDANAAG
jgi:hypothetical protein